MPPGFAIFGKVSSEIRQNLAAVRERIAIAASRAGRVAAEIKLVAISKTRPADSIREAIAEGISAFGENKVQEAEQKITEIGREAAEWHLVGHLQKNKARRAVQLFDVIHSVDSPELAHRLERICIEEGRERLSVLVQVDLAGEATKSGVPETGLQMIAEVLKRSERLSFDGLMILPPYFDDPEMARPFFARLRAVRDRLASENAFSSGFGQLSMGMSHDLDVAIEEGSTIVRVGTAIFGERG